MRKIINTTSYANTIYKPFNHTSLRIITNHNPGVNLSTQCGSINREIDVYSRSTLIYKIYYINRTTILTNFTNQIKHLCRKLMGAVFKNHSIQREVVFRTVGCESPLPIKIKLHPVHSTIIRGSRGDYNLAGAFARVGYSNSGYGLISGGLSFKKKIMTLNGLATDIY